MNSRCLVDLIDFQTQLKGKFESIMVFQDHLTKFALLRALDSKWAEDVAYHLNYIFLTIVPMYFAVRQWKNIRQSYYIWNHEYLARA